jgi:hypothetical protein
MATPTLIDPNQGSAQDIAAQLLRAQFDEWQSTFQPIELAAMQQLSFNNPAVLDTAVNKAGGAATMAADTMQGVASRQNRALGIQPTQQQAATTNRILDINKATSVAGAENTARANVRAQDELILMGQMPNPNIASTVKQ